MAGDWGFLSRLLYEVQSHTTSIGSIWMTVLFLFRIMVLCGPAESVWDDDKSGLYCLSLTYICSNVCYNQIFPISHIRYWTMQIIFVATPTLCYLGHVIHITHKEDKLREQLASPAPPGGTRRLQLPKYTDVKGHVEIKGELLCSYLIHLVVKIIIEAASICGQHYLYGFDMKATYKCKSSDIIPDLDEMCVTTCYTSRPSEKTFLILFMLVVACFSVLLNIIEMLYLLCKGCKRRNQRVVKKRTTVEDPDSLPGSSVPSYLQITEDTQRQNNHVIVELESGLGRSFTERMERREALIHNLHSEDFLSSKVTENND